MGPVELWFNGVLLSATVALKTFFIDNNFSKCMCIKNFQHEVYLHVLAKLLMMWDALWESKKTEYTVFENTHNVKY